MLFLKFKTTQKLLLCFLTSAMFFSCSPGKKVSVTSSRKASQKKVVELDTKTIDVFDKELKAPERTELPTEPSEKVGTIHKADKVISTARTFIGTPYKYGGTTRSGMDCSGLLINSFSAVKVNLPRSSEAQSKVGTEIKMNELQPGDLVFFATGDKKKQITHVGLVTDVKSKDNIKFIHASSKLGVVETNLFAEYYQKRFRVARRIID